MGLVKENISFQRNSSEEAIKSTLFGFRVGQIVAQKGQRELTSIFVIEYIVDSELPEIEITIMGLGYVYSEHYLKSVDYRSALPDKWFEFSGGLSTSLIDRKNIRSITNEERELIKQAIIKDPKKFEDKKRQFETRAPGRKILFETQSFKRGLSTSEIKDKLVGFRPGELITHIERSPNKPYQEVYMFIENSSEKFNDGIPIITSYIGALSRRDGKLSQFLIRNKKILGTIPLWAEGKRGLTKEEMEKVRKTFSEIPRFINKIQEETGITPALNESIEFKRGAGSEREIKEKLLGWRRGQILVKNDDRSKRLLVFAGITEKPLFPGDNLVIRCLEIGHVGGTPKYAYIHFGFTEDIMLKKKDELRLPNEEEIVAIQKALRDSDYQKYVHKAEEKIGARLFV